MPQLGPDATGVGWVFQYALVDESGQHDLAALRSFQDWYLQYWLRAVEGVAEVASIGGFVRQYQVNLDPTKYWPIASPSLHYRNDSARATMTWEAGSWSSPGLNTWSVAAATSRIVERH